MKNTIVKIVDYYDKKNKVQVRKERPVITDEFHTMLGDVEKDIQRELAKTLYTIEKIPEENKQ